MANQLTLRGAEPITYEEVRKVFSRCETLTLPSCAAQNVYGEIENVYGEIETGNDKHLD